MASIVGAAALVGLVLGLAVGVAVGAVVLVALLLTLTAAVGGAVVVATAVRNAQAVALKGITVVPADAADHARLHNLTEGLCSTLGVSKPALVVVDVPAANAAALASTAADASVVVTTGLLEVLDRVELEGVLASQLRRIRDQEALVATRAVPFASGPAARLPGLATRLAPVLGTVDDIFLDDRAAVDVTRYPPGLVGALGKIRDRGADVPGANPQGAHLWLVPPAAGPLAELPSIDDRIAALREL